MRITTNRIGRLAALGALLACIFLGGVLVRWGEADEGDPGEPDASDVWVCPPCSVDCHDQSYDGPGACAHCGMTLVPESTVPQIAVLVYDGVDLGSMSIPASVFQTSNAAHVFTVADMRDPIRCQAFQTIVPGRSFAETSRVDVLVVPGGIGLVAASQDRLLLDWVARMSDQARCVLGVGAGTWLLAEAGTLEGSTVTAPAAVAARIQAAAGEGVTVRSEVAVLESGHVITARDAAASAGAALDIVHALAGEAKAVGAASRLGFAWSPDADRGSLRERPKAPAHATAPARAKRHRSPGRVSADRDAGSRDGASESRTAAADADTVSTAAADAPGAYRGTDWPALRGPRGDGRSTERGFADQGEAVWRAEVGLGHSGVAIAGGRLVTVGFDADASQDIVRCLDAATGAELWRFAYAAERNQLGHGGGSLTTPTIRDDRVFVSHRTGELRCFDLSDGTLVWHRQVARDHGLEGTEYGFGASPLLVGDRVVYAVGGLVALDATTAKTVWVTESLEAMYSTPARFESSGKARVAAFTKRGLYVVDPSDGRVLNHHPFRKGRTTVNASTPIVLDGGRIFLSSGYNHGATLVRLGDEAVMPLWENRVMRTKLSGCVEHEGYLYGFDENTLKCIDLEGAEQWRKRGLGMGSLMIADGRLIVLGERGDLVLADATPEGYQERSRRRVLEGGTCWTAPALAHGRLYCRNSAGRLVCIDQRPR